MGKLTDFLDSYNSEETKRNYGSAIRTFLAFKYDFTLYKVHVSPAILEKQRVDAEYLVEKGAQVDFSFDKLLATAENDRGIEKLRKIYFDTKYRFTQEGIIEQSQEDLKELADEYMIQYIKELQKERLHSIIREIEKAEHKGDKEALAKLMSEFTKLSQEI